MVVDIVGMLETSSFIATLTFSFLDVN
jgi:hypothetical protein